MGFERVGMKRITTIITAGMQMRIIRAICMSKDCDGCSVFSESVFGSTGSGSGVSSPGSGVGCGFISGALA